MSNLKQKVLKVAKRLLRSLVPLVYFPAKRASQPNLFAAGRMPRQILLLNPAHIGDIIIATSVLPVLRGAFPDIRIGFVGGSWSQMVLKNHPEVSYSHSVDHWRLNRSSKSFLAKWLQYRRTRRQALKEIRAIGYDAAISIFNVNPDLFNISWAARIPFRVCFSGSFFSALATSVVPDIEDLFLHQSERLSLTLRALPIPESLFSKLQSILPPSDKAAELEVCRVLGFGDIHERKYKVVHMGTGASMREMPVSFWREVTSSLTEDCPVLFTGRGPEENEKILQVTRGLPNCFNGCDKLSWSGYIAAVRYAESLYGVESMAGHVASAVGTKSVVVYHGGAGVARWRPAGKLTTVFTNHVPCAPCFNPRGCESMACLKGIDASSLISIQ